MKNYKKISLVLICMAMTIPMLSPAVLGETEVGEYSFAVSAGFYIVWEVSEAYNFELNEYGWNEPSVAVKDQFKFTIKGPGYFKEQTYWGSDDDPDPTEHPCITATLSYYNYTSEIWLPVIGGGWGGSSVAFFMYNTTSHTYFGGSSFLDRFLLFLLPPTINLTRFGEDIIFEDSRTSGSHTNVDYNDYTATSDTLNFTYSGGGYNSFKQNRANGIVDTWNYNYSESKIVAEFVDSGYTSSVSSIPFGSEFIIAMGICAIGLIIIVRKKILIKK